MLTLNQSQTYANCGKPREIRWYFDNQLKLTEKYFATGSPVPTLRGLPAGTFSYLDAQAQGMALTLGTGVGYPMDVDWVRIWGQ